MGIEFRNVNVGEKKCVVININDVTNYNQQTINDIIYFCANNNLTHVVVEANNKRFDEDQWAKIKEFEKLIELKGLKTLINFDSTKVASPEIKDDTLFNTNEIESVNSKISKIVEQKPKDYTPLENLMWAYTKVTQLRYLSEEIPEDNNGERRGNDSRSIYGMFRSGKAVCVGYCEMLKALIEEIGDKNIELFYNHVNLIQKDYLNDGRGSHATLICRIKDLDKGIDGLYYLDPTNDSVSLETKTGATSLNHFLVPISDLDKFKTVKIVNYGQSVRDAAIDEHDKYALNYMQNASTEEMNKHGANIPISEPDKYHLLSRETGFKYGGNNGCDFDKISIAGDYLTVNRDFLKYMKAQPELIKAIQAKMADKYQSCKDMEEIHNKVRKHNEQAGTLDELDNNFDDFRIRGTEGMMIKTKKDSLDFALNQLKDLQEGIINWEDILCSSMLIINMQLEEAEKELVTLSQQEVADLNKIKQTEVLINKLRRKKEVKKYISRAIKEAVAEVSTQISADIIYDALNKVTKGNEIKIPENKTSSEGEIQDVEDVLTNASTTASNINNATIKNNPYSSDATNAMAIESELKYLEEERKKLEEESGVEISI